MKSLASILFVCFSIHAQLLAVVAPDSLVVKNDFITDIKVFKTNLNLDYLESAETVNLPIDKIKKRLRKAPLDVRVEPVNLTLQLDNTKNENAYYRSLASRLARDGRIEDVVKLLRKHAELVKENDDEGKKTIEFVRDDFRFIHPKKFSQFFGRTHRNVAIQTSKLANDVIQKNEFISQLSGFLTPEQTQKVEQRIQGGLPLQVDEMLLPKFASKVVKQFSIFRGPNCFHAALSFVSPLITKSEYINIKEEQNYHRAMINYDELWRVLKSEFYEVDAHKFGLKYGDILVYFDYLDGQSINFRWIKHTAAYLFGPYTFSKGSKSANSPYTIKTLSEEWDTWSKNSKQLGIKVFRRLQNNVSKTPTLELDEWLY